MKAVAFVVWAAIGLLQIFATVDGIAEWLGLPMFLCWLAALFLGWMPVVGTALGIYGAYAVWGWSLPAAVGLFLGIPLLFLGVSAAAGLIAARASRPSS